MDCINGCMVRSNLVISLVPYWLYSINLSARYSTFNRGSRIYTLDSLINVCIHTVLIKNIPTLETPIASYLYQQKLIQKLQYLFLLWIFIKVPTLSNDPLQCINKLQKNRTPLLGEGLSTQYINKTVKTIKCQFCKFELKSSGTRISWTFRVIRIWHNTL